MTAKSKKPEIRFAGFEDEWTQCKLSDIADKVTEKNNCLQYVETFTNSAEHGIISQRDFFDHNISNINSINGYFVVRNEDFVYNPRISVTAPVGPINRNKLGRSGLMSPLYTVFRTHDINNTFLEYFFKSKCWHPYMRFNGDSGTRSDRFSIKDELFFQIPISTSEIKEQQKIGEHLVALDKLISTAAYKLEKLVIIKKSTLEKMFPKDGNKTPEIRFGEFATDWTQEDAKTIFRTVVDKGHPELPVLSASQEHGMIKRTDNGINITFDTENQIGYKRVLPEQFVIHLRSFQGGFAHSQLEGITSPAYTVFEFQNKERHYDYFWKYIFNAEAFIRRLELITYGIRDGRSINYADFATLNFLFPSYDEQCKIANYLRNQDKLIMLQQQKIQKLKNIKSACMEKMFV